MDPLNAVRLKEAVMIRAALMTGKQQVLILDGGRTLLIGPGGVHHRWWKSCTLDEARELARHLAHQHAA